MKLFNVFQISIIFGWIPSWFAFATWQFRLGTTKPPPKCDTQPFLAASTTPKYAVTKTEAASHQPHDATLATALCVIPPDSAWDTIQRARHLARDRSYFRFPPAIRLFHPFCPRSKLSDAAMDVAQVLEKYNVTPFSVLLNQWVVIPHWEALEADWEAMRQLPLQQESQPTAEGAMSEMDQLIEREEQVGLQRRIKRLVRRLRKDGSPETTELSPPAIQEMEQQQHAEEQDSPQALLEKQKQMYEEFNGPCVVCLEPDETSREHLLHLREILRKELFATYEKYSPTSSVSTTERLPRAVVEAEESTFRPLVPIGAFPTVNSAIEMARKLRGLWDPLSFNVTDLHIISQGKTDIIQQSSEQEFGNINVKKTSWVSQDEEQHLNEAQYGCDAMIRLVGEELVMDNDLNAELANMVMKNGVAGGYEASRHVKSTQQQPRSTTVSSVGKELSSNNNNNEDDRLDAWLDDDEDWDEGTVVVLGRTHFFTGEMRVYVGMPAASVIDAKDKALGEGVSGAARRRGSTHRQSDVWNAGEFGRRDADFKAKSNREKRRN